MTHEHFYKSDGTPLTGKSPVQVRVRGGTMSEATLAGVRGVLSSFLGGARISLAQNLQKTVTLPGGVTVRMSSRYGVVSADVDIPPTEVLEDDTPEFYGGIVIRPIYHVDESVMYGPSAPNTTNTGTPLPEATSAGRTEELPGRPALPVKLGKGATEYLLFQISKDLPLEPEAFPLQTGAVKIYRIREPKIGLVYDTNIRADKYLLSADSDFRKFYICGVQALNIPPLPSEEVFPSYTLRLLRSISFEPESFDTAAQTHGIIVVVAGLNLWAVNTRDRPPAGEATWQLLATAVFEDRIDYVNSFGTTYTTERAPNGTTTVTCSGANGAGVCSGFSVTLTPTTGGVSMSGALNPMHDGSVASTNGVHTYSATLSFSGSIVEDESPSVYLGGTVAGPLPIKYRSSSIVYHRSRVYTPGVAEKRTDRKAGGFQPYYDAIGTSDVLDITCEGDFGEWLVGDVRPFPDPPNYIQNLSAAMRTTLAYENVVTVSGATADSRTTTTTFSADYFTYADAEDFEDPVGGGFSYVRTTTAGVTSLLPDPVLELRLTGGDPFGMYRWSRRAARTATKTPYGVESGPAGVNREILPATVSETKDFSALALSRYLRRGTGELIFEQENALERFSTATPGWAGPQSFTQTPEEKYIMHYYLTGPRFVLPTGFSPNRTAKYFDWFPVIHPSPWAYEMPGYLPGVEGAVLEPTGTTGGTYSFSYGYDGSESNSYSFGDYIVVQPQSFYAYFPSELTNPDIIRVDVPFGESEGTAVSSDAYAGPLLGNFTTFDVIYADPRTGGYITQSIWWHQPNTPENSDYEASYEAYIGNDVSFTPLRPILDQWRALGEADSTVDSKTVFLYVDVTGYVI